jgi:hypothetical protein
MMKHVRQQPTGSVQALGAAQSHPVVLAASRHARLAATLLAAGHALGLVMLFLFGHSVEFQALVFQQQCRPSAQLHLRLALR